MHKLRRAGSKNKTKKKTMKKRQQSQMQISIEAKAKKGGQPWELVGVLITHTGTQCLQEVFRQEKGSH